MRAPIYLAALVPVFASAASIEGAFLRFEHAKLVVDKTAIRGADPLKVPAKDLAVSFVDYHLRFDGTRVFVREGDVVAVDPETMDASVLFSHEEEKEGLRVLTLVCRYEKEFAAGVMITRRQATPEPDSINSGVYYSIRASQFSVLKAAVKEVVLQSALCVRKKGEFARVQDMPIAASLLPLDTFLSKEPNSERSAAPERAAGRGLNKPVD